MLVFIYNNCIKGALINFFYKYVSSQIDPFLKIS